MTAKGSYSSASDVWSFGVCLWEIQALGQLPYGELSAEEVHEQIAENGLRLTPPEDCPAVLAGLMTRCWMLETAVRPTFADLEGELSQLRANLRKATGGQSRDERTLVPSPKPQEGEGPGVGGLEKSLAGATQWFFFFFFLYSFLFFLPLRIKASSPARGRTKSDLNKLFKMGASKA